MEETTVKEGEYSEKGDYHKHLDKNWRYYPVYVEKMKFMKKYLSGVSKKSSILDLGCGEGILVEEYAQKGYNIKGIDYNYSSKHVEKGDITNLKTESNSVDLALSLDVLEHLEFAQQEKAVKEIYRILKPGGKAVISIPNLAHFACRLRFLLTGKLLRTSTPDRHMGDRPVKEYLGLFKDAGFTVVKRKGLFPTYPIISLLTYYKPGSSVWLHSLHNKVAWPNFCFLNIIEIQKKK